MGFNWLLYYAFNNPFANVFHSDFTNVFSTFTDKISEWGSLNYGDEITKVATMVGTVIGSLPPPLLYLMGVGFAFTIFGVIISMIIRLL